jgi:hypothetical protein
MVSVRKRGKVYEYRIEIASIDGTRKWLTKSGFKTKQEALHEGALAYNEYYYYGKKNKNRDMSFADYLDYWIDNYCNFNLKYATIVTYNIFVMVTKEMETDIVDRFKSYTNSLDILDTKEIIFLD